MGSDFETVLGYDASRFSRETVGSESSNRRNGLDKVLLKKIKNIIRNETGLGRESINRVHAWKVTVIGSKHSEPPNTAQIGCFYEWCAGSGLPGRQGLTNAYPIA